MLIPLQTGAVVIVVPPQKTLKMISQNEPTPVIVYFDFDPAGLQVTVAMRTR